MNAYSLSDEGFKLEAVDMKVRCEADTETWDIDTTNLCQGMSDKYSLHNAYSLSNEGYKLGAYRYEGEIPN